VPLDGLRPSGGRASGGLAYSVFQQGAGLVNAIDALASTAGGCANNGLNIDRDFAGVEHYGGRANVDANGNYTSPASTASSGATVTSGTTV